MCSFIAQLVEQRTGNAEVTGSNPDEALIFSGFFFPIPKSENVLRLSFFTFRLEDSQHYTNLFNLCYFQSGGEYTVIFRELL